jgi:hypothetical protein
MYGETIQTLLCSSDKILTDISPAISKVVSHQLPTSGPHLRSGHKGFVDKVTWMAVLWVSQVPLPILILLASPY